MRQVQEVIRYQEMTRVPLVPRVIRGLINLRGQIVVAIDLRRRLNAPERPEDQLPMNVVVAHPTARSAFSSMKLATCSNPGRNLRAPARNASGRRPRTGSGCAQASNGLLLILDTEKAVNVADMDALHAGAEA